MKSLAYGRWVGATLVLTWVVAVVSCSANQGHHGSSATGGTGGTATSSGGSGGSGGVGGLGLGGTTTTFTLPEAGPCVPSTCAQLNANCGPTTDPKCGGVVQCGTCPTGQTCGGTGPNQCGWGSPDGCAPLTCAAQNANCGQVGDGCGGMLSCGSCTVPQTCGGGGQPNACGCTGVCAQIPDCSEAGGPTTLSGIVYDPAGKHPLYNALVYIPNDPNDPGLQPFAAGITCDVCGSTAAGNPLVTAYTTPDGKFTLTGVPAGLGLPLVVQLGRWRRQFKVDITTSCGANSVAAGTLTMPKNHTEGDIPRIGILTGAFDPIECVLRKMGVQDTEFTNPGGGGNINFYLASEANRPSASTFWEGYQKYCPANPWGHGASIDANTPNQAALFTGTTINQYDVVVGACEGYEENEQANWAALGAYTAAGGRVFASDFAFDWIVRGNQVSAGPPAATNPAYPNVANWDVYQNSQGAAETGTIDLVSNPKGMAFKQWLEIVGASPQNSGTMSLNPVYHNTNSVVAPTQQWLYWGGSTPIQFTFNTPVGAPSAQQCGRVVFNDWHADQLGFKNAASYPSCPFILPTKAPFYGHDLNFPAECDNNAMTPQEAVLEFMLFDLTACVTPYTPLCAPTTCSAQGIECGYAGDGCGNLLPCGTCPTGQYCGGGGAGKCGMMNNCMPSTCAAQNLQCGQAGDGCGGTLDCGNCPTGQVCGLNGPGQCGKTQQ